MWRIIKRYGQLRRAGVLGLNARNGRYIMGHNDRKHYPLVDDKIRCKRMCEAHGVAVPGLIGEIRTQFDLRHLSSLLEGREGFVVKPANGSGGDGIVVITGRMNGRFQRSSGQLMDLDGMRHHVLNILSGMYSLGGQPDAAMLEELVAFDPGFAKISHQGVPDIRLIVFRGVPVMAMTRLPTRMSDGKANLHQGAVGAGIDLATGRTLDGVWHNDFIAAHPDTGHSISNLSIPGWDTILDLAARSYDMTTLGYLGVDLVIDRERGPLILELNARPGLNIQIANGVGLAERLQRVSFWLERLAQEPDAAERIDWARRQFAQAVPEHN